MEAAVKDVFDSLTVSALRAVAERETTVNDFSMHKDKTKEYMRSSDLSRYLSLARDRSCPVLTNLLRTGLVIRLRLRPITYVMSDKGKKVLSVLDALEAMLNENANQKD